MVGFRISGIVRASRDAHARVRTGVPPGQRAAFLEDLGRTIRRVESLCAEGGVTPADLPPPSRRALADLRALAALDPADIPAPTAAAPSRRIAISNVVATLDHTLEALSDSRTVHADLPQDDPFDELTGILEGAHRCVAAVERICAEKGTRLSALPARTGRAYALLKWLLDSSNLELYLEQRDAAASALLRAVRDHPEGRPAWRHLLPAVSFRPGRASRVTPRPPDLQVRLDVGWLGATDDELDALAELAVLRGRASPRAHRTVGAFRESEASGAVHLELEALRDEHGDRPQGRVRDLLELFERLDDRFFGGTLPRPRLAWHAGASLGRFGCYLPSRDQVLLDVRLDDEAVPEFVAEFVLFHELLHKVHGSHMRGGRRHVHTPAFRADERRHPRAEEAEQWLTRLMRASDGRDVSDPEAAPPTPFAAPPPSARPPGPRHRVTHAAKVPRNAPCPCGSGRKHKKCCLR